MTAIVAGSRITVHDVRGDWLGYIQVMPDFATATATVSVIDPRGTGLARYSVQSVSWRAMAVPANLAPSASLVRGATQPPAPPSGG